jgi:phage baseplate assembly protein W
MNSGFGTKMIVSYYLAMPGALLDLQRSLTELGVTLILNANGLLVVVEQNSDNLLLAHNVQVGVVATLELVVHISVSSILASAVGTNVLQPSFGGVVGVEVLQVFELAVAHLVRRVDEGLLSLLAAVCALRDIDRAAIAVSVSVSQAMIVLELVQYQ